MKGHRYFRKINSVRESLARFSDGSEVVNSTSTLVRGKFAITATNNTRLDRVALWYGAFSRDANSLFDWAYIVWLNWATWTIKGFSVLGIDRSENLLEKAKSNVPSGIFHKAEIEEYEIEGSYIGVVLWDSIFHIPREEHHSILEKVYQNPDKRYIL